MLSGNQTDAVVYDNGLDTFLFFGKFGHDVITDFHIGFSTIAFLGGIDESDVTVKTKGDDVKIVVSAPRDAFDPGQGRGRSVRSGHRHRLRLTEVLAGLSGSPACRRGDIRSSISGAIALIETWYGIGDIAVATVSVALPGIGGEIRAMGQTSEI